MNLELLTQRQAVTEWRDRQLFQIMSMLNSCAINARQELEEHIQSADLLQSMLTPANFVNTHIDTFMKEQVQQRTQSLFKQAGEELSALDERFGPLALALCKSVDALDFPVSSDAMQNEANPEPVKEAEKNFPSKSKLLFQTNEFFSGLSLTRSAREWSIWASDTVSAAADTVSRSLQDRTGLYERLRRLASERITTAWMGNSGHPHALRAQLFLLVDDVANEARSINL